MEGERFYDVELYRLKRVLLLARSQEQDAEVETCFQQTLESPAISRPGPWSCGRR
jgi:hypothetical protein